MASTLKVDTITEHTASNGIAISVTPTLAADLKFSATSADIIPGATSLLFRNNADNATNLSIADAGAIVFRGALSGATTASLAGPITLTTAASKIIPGATSLSLRNNADSADNLLITDAGVATFRSDIISGSLRLTTISSQAVFIHSALTVALTHAAITQNSSGDTIVNAVSARRVYLAVNNTTSAAGFSFTLDAIFFGAATTYIVPGATAINVRNTANNADNLIITDAGVVTFRSTAVTSASTTARAGLRIPHGTAPTSPVDGDMWTTTTTLNVQLNGVTKSVVFV